MSRDLSIRFLTVAGCLLFALAGVISPNRVQAATTWSVAMGAQSKDMSRQAMAFLPNEIWIKQYDGITWTSQTDEIHTVSLLKQSSGGAPLVGTSRPPFPAGCTAGGQGGPVGTPNPSSFDGTACVNSNVLPTPQS